LLLPLPKGSGRIGSLMDFGLTLRCTALLFAFIAQSEYMTHSLFVPALSLCLHLGNLSSCFLMISHSALSGALFVPFMFSSVSILCGLADIICGCPVIITS
jgi:hypothetical protein